MHNLLNKLSWFIPVVLSVAGVPSDVSRVSPQTPPPAQVAVQPNSFGESSQEETPSYPSDSSSNGGGWWQGDGSTDANRLHPEVLASTPEQGWSEPVSPYFSEPYYAPQPTAAPNTFMPPRGVTRRSGTPAPSNELFAPGQTDSPKAASAPTLGTTPVAPMLAFPVVPSLKDSSNAAAPTTAPTTTPTAPLTPEASVTASVQLKVSPGQAAHGSRVTVTWSVTPASAATPLDWIGLFASESAGLPLHLTAGKATGEVTQIVDSIIQPGTYSVRYVFGASGKVGATNQLTIVAAATTTSHVQDTTGSTPAPETTVPTTDELRQIELSAVPDHVAPGDTMTVHWSLVPATLASPDDVIELCLGELPAGVAQAQETCVPLVSTAGAADGNNSVTIPMELPLGRHALQYRGVHAGITRAVLDVVSATTPDNGSGAPAAPAEPEGSAPDEPEPTVPPIPPTLTFDATKSTIVSGEGTLLIWNSTDAQGCQAEGGWSGAKGVSDQEWITPQTTTTYRLTCTESGESVTETVTVTVTSDPDVPPTTLGEDAAYQHLAERMDARFHGDQLRLIESYIAPYPSGPDGTSLSGVALTADNALAALAFLARGQEDDLRRAKILCDTLLWYQGHDLFADHRLRQAYQSSQDLAGAAQDAPEIPPAFRATSVDELAWAGLAWLTYFERVRDPHTSNPREDLKAVYLEAAIAGADLMVDHLKADAPGEGFYWGVRDTTPAALSLTVSPERMAPGGTLVIDWAVPMKDASDQDTIQFVASFGTLGSYPTSGQLRGRMTPALPSGIPPMTLQVQYRSGVAGPILASQEITIDAAAPAVIVPSLPAPEPELVTETMTDQNLLAYVLLMRLYDLTGEERWLVSAAHAKQFLETVAWSETRGTFSAGLMDHQLDTLHQMVQPQALALLGLGKAAAYGRALDWVDEALKVSAGEATSDGFSGYDAGIDLEHESQPDGIWFAGTAEMALAYQVASDLHPGKSDYYLAKLEEAQHHPHGNGKGLVAASHNGVSSGMGDARYDASTHIGTTAWYLLAHRHRNPLWATATDKPVPHEASSPNPVTVPENTAPVLASIGNQRVVVNGKLTFLVSATDKENDPLVFSTSTLPTGAKFQPDAQDPSKWRFTWIPTGQQVGDTAVTFRVSDGTADDSETITITVDPPPNQPPVLAPIGNQTVVVSGKLSLTVSASDPEQAPLTLRATLANGQEIGTIGATFTDNTNGTGSFVWAPTAAQVGDYRVTFTATDPAGQSNAETVTITVKPPPNQPPVLDPVGDQTVVVSGKLQFTVSASDPEGEPVTLSATGLPTGASFTTVQGTGTVTQTFVWVPAADQVGTYRVLFTATDRQGLTTAKPVTIIVKPQGT